MNESLGRRLLLLPLTFLGITLVTFLLMQLAPGDPALVRAGTGRGVSPESIAAFRETYGLDRPLPGRYVEWLGRSLRFDFGRSLTDGRKVSEKLGEALPVTFALALLSAAIAYLIAIPLGCLLAAGDGTGWVTLAGNLLALVYALPVMAVGLFALELGAPYGGVRALGCAAGCIALAPAVRLARHQRGALLSVLATDYVRTARAKGLGPLRVLFGHALKNALLPMVTLFANELPMLLSGSVLAEEIFGIHGLGLAGFDAVLAYDYPVLLGLTSLGAVLTLGSVLLADLSYGLLDPRLRQGRG